MKILIMLCAISAALPAWGFVRITVLDEESEEEFLEITENEMSKLRLWASEEMDKIRFTTETILAQESDLWKKDFINFTGSEMYLWRKWASQEVINLTPEIKKSIESLKQPINRLSGAMEWLIFIQIVVIIVVILCTCRVVNTIQRW